MYPEKPWKAMSRDAISCIQRLLVVQHEARYTVDQALADRWLTDRQCVADISKLEEEAILIIITSYFILLPGRSAVSG